MSLLTICQSVMKETGWPVPSAIASSTDGTAQQIMAIANTELRALSEKFNWPQLRTEYEFNTVVDQTEYSWPADFRFLAWDGVFDTTEYYRVRGSTPLREWNRWVHGLLGQLNFKRFLSAYDSNGDPVIQFSPAPAAVGTLVAFYFTNEYARNDTGDSIAKYASDADVSKIPERLVELGVKWRFRRAKGLDYSAELAEYNSDVASQYARYLGSGDIPIGGRQDLDFLTDGYVPDSGFGS